MFTEARRTGVGIADPETERDAPIEILGRALRAIAESDALRARGRVIGGERAVFVSRVGTGGCCDDEVDMQIRSLLAILVGSNKEGPTGDADTFGA